MGFVPAPNVIQVDIRFTASGVFVGQNTSYWFDNSGAPPDLERLDELLFQLQSAVIATANNYWSTGVQIDRLDARDLSTQFGLVSTLAGDVETGGASTGALLPRNVTASVAFKTGMAGRSFRGRNYAVGLTEAMVTGDYLIAPYDARMAGHYSGLAAALLDDDFIQVVLSRTSNGVDREEALATPITSWSLVDLRVDTMRSRLD